MIYQILRSVDYLQSGIYNSMLWLTQMSEEGDDQGLGLLSIQLMSCMFTAGIVILIFVCLCAVIYYYLKKNTIVRNLIDHITNKFEKKKDAVKVQSNDDIQEIKIDGIFDQNDLESSNIIYI